MSNRKKQQYNLITQIEERARLLKIHRNPINLIKNAVDERVGYKIFKGKPK